MAIGPALCRTFFWAAINAGFVLFMQSVLNCSIISIGKLAKRFSKCIFISDRILAYSGFNFVSVLMLQGKTATLQSRWLNYECFNKKAIPFIVALVCIENFKTSVQARPGCAAICTDCLLLWLLEPPNTSQDYNNFTFFKGMVGTSFLLIG